MIATAARSAAVSVATGWRTSGASPKASSNRWALATSSRQRMRPPKPVW
jgi:hypothetical protein